MFDPDLYRKTCSEGMKFSEETLEEMIFMTENKKRGLRRPVRIALTAAALAVVMCVTAAAANPEAVKELWESITMSVVVVQDDGDTLIMRAEMPDVTVERVDGRAILTVDGVQADITEALDRDGEYRQTIGSGDTVAELTVNADLTWGITMSLVDGSTVRYGTDEQCDVIYTEQSGGPVEGMDTFVFTDDETRTDATYLPPEE